MYFIGSTFMKLHYDDFKRVPQDIDVLVKVKSETTKEIIGLPPDKRIEFHIIPPLMDWLNTPYNYLNKDVMYTLKVSHLFWDIKWEKHIFDAVFMQERGAKLIPELFDQLYAHWNEFHGNNKRSDLKMSKADFFDNALKKYDHDALHYLINPVPIFTKVLADGQEVEVSKAKFDALTWEDKIELVREELYIMSYERLGGRGYREAYSWIFKKFIISHAPIWEALFIIENYKHLYKPFFNYKTFLDDRLAKQ